jgi:hypothetical protein
MIGVPHVGRIIRVRVAPTPVRMGTECDKVSPTA